MKSYLEMSAEERREELAAQQALYEQEKRAGLNLDMSRGKPDATQLNLSMDMLEQNPYDLIYTRKGTDVRNYGELAGVDEAKELFDGRGGNIRTMYIEHHDEYMSYVLGLSHAVNIAFFTVLERSGITFSDMQTVASTTFRKNMDTNASVALEDPQLYYEIQHLNRNRDEMWNLFSEAVEDLKEASLSDDPSEFVDLMHKGRDYFS